MINMDYIIVHFDHSQGQNRRPQGQAWTTCILYPLRYLHVIPSGSTISRTWIAIWLYLVTPLHSPQGSYALHMNKIERLWAKAPPYQIQTRDVDKCRRNWQYPWLYTTLWPIPGARRGTPGTRLQQMYSLPAEVSTCNTVTNNWLRNMTE